ncbi:MAG: hypothetical protein HYW25_04250 [Candidatus Aenigmarchaeota archaeon]|nr:hypothetical protein [Candidatus Aenigmarchaeota archaeon]
MVKVTTEKNIVMVSCLGPREQLPYERLRELHYREFGGRYRNLLLLYLRRLAESTENDEIALGRLAEMRGGTRPYTAFRPQTGTIDPDFGLYNLDREVFIVPGHTLRSEFHPLTVHLVGEPCDTSGAIADFINDGFLWEDSESRQDAINAADFLDILLQPTPPQPASSA